MNDYSIIQQGDTIPVTPSSLSLTLVDPVTTSVYHKNLIMKQYVQKFTYQENRKIFTTIRSISNSITPDTFFPKKGFVAGEFATYYLLSSINHQSSAATTLPSPARKKKNTRRA